MKTQISSFEIAVADALTKTGWDVFAATKDRGVDLVAFPSLQDGQPAIRIQVKGSRTYTYDRFQGWFIVKPDDLSNGQTDVWIFVCFVPITKGRLQPQFAAISPAELLRRLGSYGRVRDHKMNFYLTEHNGRLVDNRGFRLRAKNSPGEREVPPERDYTEFWGREKLVEVITIAIDGKRYQTANVSLLEV